MEASQSHSQRTDPPEFHVFLNCVAITVHTILLQNQVLLVFNLYVPIVVIVPNIWNLLSNTARSYKYVRDRAGLPYYSYTYYQ
jgi:hypothetical protein